MSEISMKKKFNDGSKFLQQIMAIENYGCNGLKCHNCCLQNLCPRIPAVAKNVAAKILSEAYASLVKNKDKPKNV